MQKSYWFPPFVCESFLRHNLIQFICQILPVKNCFLSLVQMSSAAFLSKNTYVRKIETRNVRKDTFVFIFFARDLGSFPGKLRPGSSSCRCFFNCFEIFLNFLKNFCFSAEPFFVQCSETFFALTFMTFWISLLVIWLRYRPFFFETTFFN